MIRPMIVLTVPIVCLLGCYKYEVIDVDTVDEWCYLIERNDELGEYWGRREKFEFNHDAIREDYVSRLNATHLGETDNRITRVAWREEANLHLLNLAAVSDMDADAFTEEWQSKIAAAIRLELDRQEDVCLYRGIATLFDNVVIHTPQTDPVQPGISADGIVIIPTKQESADVQRLVEQIVARHPKLVRLTIHAVPTSGTESRIIASNISDKLGNLSDPEDLRVMTTKEIVVLREGNNLDVTMPILDKAGKAVAATGITLEEDGVTSETALMMEAQVIARELTMGIQAAKRLPW